MNTDLRERIARAIATGTACDSPYAAADAVLAELGLTEAEPVAWGKRDKQGGIWECVDSRELAYSNGTPEYNIPLYAAPQPQAEPVAWDDLIERCEFEVTFDGETKHRMKLGAYWVDDKGFRSMVFECAAPQPQAEPVEFQLRVMPPRAKAWSRWHAYESRQERDLDAVADRARGWQVETRDLYAAPQPQASAEDVALLDELVKYYSCGVRTPEAWQRIRASLGVGRE